MRKTLITLLAVLPVAFLATPASAEARSCGTYGTTDKGATIETDAYYAASCSFAAATASRFYAFDGVPRHLTVLGTRLTYRGTRSGSGWDFWVYNGRRYGRYLSVIITQLDSSSSSPSPSSPSRCDPNYQGACLDPNASDYDCVGGSGDGPKYTGRVVVVGYDRYGLDADGDGIGCE
jgi:hypothetical protein